VNRYLLETAWNRIVAGYLGLAPQEAGAALKPASDGGKSSGVSIPAATSKVKPPKVPR
jgi:hypothetical protein